MPPEGMARRPAARYSCRMLTYQTATDEEREQFLLLLKADAGDYLEPVLRAMGATWDDFCAMMRTVGEVRTVRKGAPVVGFTWTELRGRVLHIHGIAVRPEMRGQGVATQALRDVEAEARGRADAMELGVHDSNARALKLYERLGYHVETRLPELGFAILKKPLPAA